MLQIVKTHKFWAIYKIQAIQKKKKNLANLFIKNKPITMQKQVIYTFNLCRYLYIYLCSRMPL